MKYDHGVNTKPHKPTSGKAGVLGCVIGAVIGCFWFAPYLTCFIGAIVGGVVFSILLDMFERWIQETEDNDRP